MKVNYLEYRQIQNLPQEIYKCIKFVLFSTFDFILEYLTVGGATIKICFNYFLVVCIKN